MKRIFDLAYQYNRLPMLQEVKVILDEMMKGKLAPCPNSPNCVSSLSKISKSAIPPLTTLFATLGSHRCK